MKAMITAWYQLSGCCIESQCRVVQASWGDAFALRAPRRCLRDIRAQQGELQSHGFVKRFHGLRRVPHGAPITECASHEQLRGTPGGMISPRVPPSCSALVRGAVDAEERSVESVKSVRL